MNPEIQLSIFSVTIDSLCELCTSASIKTCHMHTTNAEVQLYICNSVPT